MAESNTRVVNGVPLSSATGRLRKFYLIDKKMLKNEAQNACRSDYTDLVTIYDEEENNELVDILNNSAYRVNGWIGGSSCKWSNGDLATFTKYSRTFKEEKCCGAINTAGRWECINCTSTKFFMCYDQDRGQQSYNYSLIRENRTWFEAQRYCRENHTDLVIIRDDEENERVKKAVNGSHSFWIGLQYNNSLDWFDGGYSDYKQNSSSEGCFTFLSRQNKNNKPGGFWFKINTGIYSALCYSKLTKYFML
ncbi:LOW QUALITY PROTEIN: secretory phospholipase A2 receptor [Rhinichthys klamathensis goyatoka]|uniref:LOW QUALITY PROTEIN: secretory phospholipase A2 receptor n=1 Tax=Rhinichthys klamathensis goyatoka TaxID=3034132 RepID=UPI0024B60DAF|nr:LOW QUALITY PROTEIN: secretory phospholipase A2 receptor [Rhinichthys klamathensis goyatoka]